MFIFVSSNEQKTITMSSTVETNTDISAGKVPLQQVRQSSHIARIIDEKEIDSAEKRHSYQEFKEKLASSLNKRFNADIEV